jgi:predicted ATPase
MSWATWLHQFRRTPALVQAQAEQAIALADQHGYTYWRFHSMVLEGWAWVQQGQVATGIVRMQEALAARLEMDAHLHGPSFQALLAEGYGKSGQPELGLEVLDQALHQVEATGERFAEAELHRFRGELLYEQGAQAQEVETCLLRALEVARRQEAKSLELRAAMSLARHWQRQGKRQAGHTLLAEVYNWFTEGFDTPDLRDASALLEELTQA